MTSARPAKGQSAFGDLLRYWRRARRRSQLELALEAAVSARHLSFVETGRSRPSREMVLRLADVLDVPLRERNALLQAAGFAPVYRETDLFAPELAPIRRSIEFLLERHDPCPALLLDRHWNALLLNRSAQRLLPALFDAGATRDASTAGTSLDPVDATMPPPPTNMMRLLFQQDGLRSFIANWHEVAAVLIQRLHREVMTAVSDDPLRTLLDELLASDGIPADWRTLDLAAAPPFVVPIHLRSGQLELSLFSALTTLGTAQDITLHELHLETFFPMDERSEAVLRGLADASADAAEGAWRRL